MFVGKDSCGKAVLSVVKLENVAKIGMDLLKVFLMLNHKYTGTKLEFGFLLKKKNKLLLHY